MLDSRYVHLHEALGLGVMWLNTNAKILPQTQPEKSKLPSAQKPLAVTVPQKTPTQAASNARLAALQRVRAHSNPDSGSLKNPQPTAPIAAPTVAPTTPVPAPTPRAKVMIISVCASPADVVAGKLFSGEDGAMLNKMLGAIGLQNSDAYLSTWLKDLPDFNPKPPTETVIAATERVAQEWRQSGASSLLLLGDFFDRADVQQQLNQFSGSEQRFHIPHPMRIVSNPKLKRSAWETLQQMQKFLQAA